MRLIDADALLYHLSDYKLQEDPMWGANGYGNQDAYEAITNCMREIENAPTVEPERKEGHWIRYGQDGYQNDRDTVYWQCDQCLCTETGRREKPMAFCPNCGAKMSSGNHPCDTCKHKNLPWNDEPCDSCCGAHSGYERG